MDAEESQKEIQAIGELILGLGGRESNSPGSSPSNVPAALGASPLAAVASPPAPARTPRQAAVQSLGAPPLKKAKTVPVPAPGLDLPGGCQERRGGGDSPLRARLAAMEMELEALKRGSDGGASQVGDWLKP